MQPEKELLSHLLERYLQGEASQEDVKLLQDWFRLLDVSEQQAIQGISNEEEVGVKMRQHIHACIRYNAKPVRNLNPVSIWLRTLAASILLVLGTLLGYPYIKGYNSPATPQVLTSQNTIKKVTLPDGTVVTMNKFASLEVDKNYNQDERKVRLVGEAFFEVKQDTLRPFIVTAHKTHTRVLGTAFNVESYKAGKEVRVALLHGKVRVQHNRNGQVTLAPGEVLVYNRASQKGTIEPVLTQHIAAWLQNKIVFDDVLLEDAIHRIQHLNQLKLQLDSALALEGKRVTGEYENDEAIKALEAILLLHNMKLKTKGGSLYITDKQ